MAPLSCYGEILGGIIFGAISAWLFFSGLHQRRELRLLRRHRDELEKLGERYQRELADAQANGPRSYAKGLEAGRMQERKHFLS